MLTPNYNYQLSSSIYKLLRFGSPEFSEFLHGIGYKRNGKSYKLFSFALQFEKMAIINGLIKLIKPSAFLYVSSPLIDSFIRNFVLGSFRDNLIEIVFDNQKTIFEIREIESLPHPSFDETNYFKMLSPLVLSTMKEFNGRLMPYYLRYYDSLDEINRILNKNLINKYEAVYNKEYNGNNVSLEWDNGYIQKRTNKGKRLTKKISIAKKGERPIDIIGNEIPFRIKGNPGLIKIGYECGFGEKNSMGFGLAEDTNYTNFTKARHELH
ncbi:MAG: CRISPR-associated endoribonuclease Cas6 [Ignavibacteria bacterium]